MLVNLVLIVSTLLVALPQGVGKASWGMSAEQLRQVTQATKADKASGYGFAEHMEIDPDVYVEQMDDGSRREYYFFQGKLYKIFVVFKKSDATPARYGELAAAFSKQYGKPSQHYQETYFGFQVQHTLWEDENTVLDLRMGAGFVYEVWLSKSLAAEKKSAHDRDKAI